VKALSHRRSEVAKDWRLAVCTRWRPLVSLLLVCLSLLCTGVIIYFVYTAVDEYPTRRLEKRIQRVKVGMSVAELESILGPPDSKPDKVDRESLNLGEGASDRIVEYRYSAVNQSGVYWTEHKVLVDENKDRIVSIRLSDNWGIVIGPTAWGEWAFLIAIGLMILVVLIVMLFFRAWCESVPDS
jgi:hypothetical protein